MIRIDEMEDSEESTIRIETQGDPVDLIWQIHQFLLDFYRRYPKLTIGMLDILMKEIRNSLIKEEK